jgi:hypothetical protein
MTEAEIKKAMAEASARVLKAATPDLNNVAKPAAHGSPAASAALSDQVAGAAANCFLSDFVARVQDQLKAAIEGDLGREAGGLDESGPTDEPPPSGA